MKRYCVRVEYSGFKKVWVEAEDEDEAQNIVLDSIDWDDLDISIEECDEIKPRKKYRIATKE